MLGFWPYHTKWGEVLSNALCSLHLWNYSDVSATQNHLFSCLLLSRMHALTMLWMILLFISFFPLRHDASPPVSSMDIFNSSTSRLVISVEFSTVPSSSTLTILHGCCSLFYVVRMKRMMWSGDRLDAVGNNHIILVFSQTTVIMELNPQMELAL